jgi:hypothetical protein
VLEHQALRLRCGGRRFVLVGALREREQTAHALEHTRITRAAFRRRAGQPGGRGVDAAGVADLAEGRPVGGLLVHSEQFVHVLVGSLVLDDLDDDGPRLFEQQCARELERSGRGVKAPEMARAFGERDLRSGHRPAEIGAVDVDPLEGELA